MLPFHQTKRVLHVASYLFVCYLTVTINHRQRLTDAKDCVHSPQLQRKDSLTDSLFNERRSMLGKEVFAKWNAPPILT